MFDLSPAKLLILVVLALIVFGPKELPKMAGQVGRALRELRRIAEGATSDLREGLGPEFSNFEIDDLNPRRFVQKHLLSEQEESAPNQADDTPAVPGPVLAHEAETLPHEAQIVVFDADAT